MIAPPHFGLGFRTPHFAALTARPRGVDWLELVSDNFLDAAGPRRAQLERLCADFPIALHGIGLGLANDVPPRPRTLAALRALADFAQPRFVSDHLCWTGLGGASAHDLLPVAATREVLALVGERVARVQDALGRRLVLENASAYVKFRADEMSEAELLAALCERTGCGVLLDVNNLFVNAANLGADPLAALGALAPAHVAYLHVAGHAALPGLRIDTHGAAVEEEVWRLFEHAARRFPHAPVILERDDAIPALAELVAELDVARARWVRGQRPAAEAGEAHDPIATTPQRVARAVASLPWDDARRAFWESIGPHGDVAADAPGADAFEATLPVAPARGLRVYRDSLHTLPERVLAANFPTLARVLSRRDFAELCAAFARAHPLGGEDPAQYGAPLAEFLADWRPSDAYAVDAGALADIARLEQAQRECQEAPSEPAGASPAALAALASDGWERARFVFSDAFRLVSTRFDVLPALRAVASGAAAPLPEPTARAFAISRSGAVVHVRPIGRVAAGVLGRLAAGATFADACAGADAGGESTVREAVMALLSVAAAGGVRALAAPGAED